MRVRLYGSQLEIALNLKDKEAISSTGIAECEIDRYKKPFHLKIVFHVVDEVPKRNFEEEKGFHVEVLPKKGGLDNRTQYDVYLSKDRFVALTAPHGIEGGSFMSRCFQDRVNINYFGNL